MNAGVLIIGSLFWDSKPHRIEWRNNHLDIEKSVKVAVPICYGRISRSRGNTYTMTFRQDESLGKAIFVPFVSRISTVDDLIEKSSALWDAEQATKRTTGTIGSSWGVVGALFKNEHQLSNEWVNYFQSQVNKEKGIEFSSRSCINENGFLCIPWLKVVNEISSLDTDIIFATVIKPENTLPDPSLVANAWVSQNDGYEEYFFKNIISGIRTPEDLDIWKIIKGNHPVWLKKDEYAEAIYQLDMELKENG